MSAPFFSLEYVLFYVTIGSVVPVRTYVVTRDHASVQLVIVRVRRKRGEQHISGNLHGTLFLEHFAQRGKDRSDRTGGM
ncbi:hypothetical protein [Burkholderia sp. LA-2-3-30-S1-D2]|uniref:hypothetical protein n=1 Tax=Burkholderia sp. LA-2-3-30-S1-D2 TaxID=1637862 RepID=UPI00131ED4BF|nr:hypothetical protein [Burkholderia sp. LA-2-3-30-S1-D2]